MAPAFDQVHFDGSATAYTPPPFNAVNFALGQVKAKGGVLIADIKAITGWPVAALKSVGGIPTT